jgi:hypothetical protein
MLCTSFLRYQRISAFGSFSRESYPEQIAKLVGLVSALAENDEFIIIVDDGGVYDDQGDYQPFIKDLIASLVKLARPVIGVVQHP